MKRFFLAVVCAVALFASTSAQAAPIITAADDNLLSTVAFDTLGNPIAFGGLSGATIALVTDGPPISLGLVAAADSDTGLFVDLPDVNDALAFDFLFGTSVFGPGGLWTLSAVGSPLFLSDPAFLPFIGVNVAQFSALSLDPIFGNDQLLGYIGVYALDFIAAPDQVTEVPEPATMGLVGLGLAAAARRRAKKSNKAA